MGDINIEETFSITMERGQVLAIYFTYTCGACRRHLIFVHEGEHYFVISKKQFGETICWTGFDEAYWSAENCQTLEKLTGLKLPFDDDMNPFVQSSLSSSVSTLYLEGSLIEKAVVTVEGMEAIYYRVHAPPPPPFVIVCERLPLNLRWAWYRVGETSNINMKHWIQLFKANQICY